MCLFISLLMLANKYFFYIQVTRVIDNNHNFRINNTLIVNELVFFFIYNFSWGLQKKEIFFFMSIKYYVAGLNIWYFGIFCTHL